MALSIPSFPNPYSSQPLEPAYGWLAGVSLDLSSDQGRIVLNVHPAEADWRKPPVAQVAISLGQIVVAANPEAGTPAVVVATLDELMASTTPVGATGVTFAQAYAVIGQALYGELVAKVPALSASTVV